MTKRFSTLALASVWTPDENLYLNTKNLYINTDNGSLLNNVEIVVRIYSLSRVQIIAKSVVNHTGH